MQRTVSMVSAQQTLIEGVPSLPVRSATDIALRFFAGRLVLHFVDSSRVAHDVTFVGVLAYGWAVADDPTLRDDTTYQVLDSAWLERLTHARLRRGQSLVHYKICLGTHVLDVACQPYVPRPTLAEPSVVT